ncbi:MAG: adenosine deaminase [Anaerolineaceae bacterium]|nr:adenosine deaminase [Anaerolineaceae bacterium]
MQWQSPISQLEKYRQIPKVDLHRHLEGAIRISTLMELARSLEITLPLQPNLHSLVQMQPEENQNFSNFLSKFSTLRLFYRTPEIIQRIAYEAVADAAADHVLHLEMIFTPVALSRARGFDMGEVMDWVAESAMQAGRDLGISVRLIASVNRHEPVGLAEETARLAAERMNSGIVGLNLAGNEAEFSALPFAEIFRQARQAGLAVSIHAGEWGGADNVRQALEELQADRIGHGVRILEDPQVVALALQKNTAFEVCLTSNFQTGSISDLKQHPISKMLRAGLIVTINTDDPSISQISLSDEYRLALETLGLKRETLNDCIRAAAGAAFLPADEKERLLEKINQQL